MKVAILGASGQLGQKTLACVIERGFEAQNIVAIARTPERLQTGREEGIEIRVGDYDDRSSLLAAFGGVDRVLLVPSIAPPPQRVQQYENAVAAAKAAGVGHLLHYGLVSTSLESPALINPFLVYAEALLRSCGLSWTILRNSLYADPIVDWVPEILKMGTIPYPTGDGRCAFVSRHDIARAGAAALTTDGHAGKIYSLTGPRALATADLCEIVSRVTGQRVEDRNASDQDYIDVCRSSDESEFLIQVLVSLYHAIRDGHFEVESDDVARLTGQPAESFEQLLTRQMRG